MRTSSHFRRIGAALAGTLVIGALICAGPVHADPQDDQQDDPELEQRIDPDQDVATDEVALDAGHVDMGPRFSDGTWTLMVHDDTAVEGSVWRPLDRTVMRVLDAGQLTVPEDEAYSFLGVDPGAQVHVVPQTQNPEVVWLGWNTQDPQVMSRVDRGVTLTMGDVTGPGELLVYLQAGGFGDPDVLWDSREAPGQDLWVDVNTHTHANWVFTEPGVYLVELTATADLVDGDRVEDTRYVRFAVGDDTDVDEALAAEPDETTAHDTGGDEAQENSDPAVPALLWWAALAVVVVLLLALAVVLSLIRGRRAKRRALAGRDGSDR
ncbi:choice-of-anchor M domain-containing protein [Aeromicrobium sp. YIM 150415]|uniref:choice-of-anchor M domain-containing protein n=1 Tax=Aeromicrobium sp. YIM 150415 TaxID=2803912 RepID=UPI00196375E8|nr:choice-of-anchor M domain-containing protein [Aeromicrobium sp. YIM 150415]MBM9463637.1 choice-of-anchor M domain-containing protein [Aeromicrobium sp. YIM 150415]